MLHCESKVRRMHAKEVQKELPEWKLRLKMAAPAAILAGAG